MAEKPKQEVGLAKQEVVSYLGNRASQSETRRKFRPCGLFNKHTNAKYVLKSPNRKLVLPNRKLGCIFENGAL